MKCVICGKELTEENKSSEHVIHNAIGGLLESEQIYCKKCNGDFGTDLDKKFTSIFAPIVDGYTMVQSRKTSGTSYTGKMKGSDNRVYVATFKNGRVVELRDENNKFYPWETGKYQLISKDFKMDNVDFAKGMIKIAFNYAISEGMETIYLNKIFDNENKVIINAPIIPFVPTNPFDTVMEICAEKDILHILRLFSCKNYIYVYIELFSTFQYYVMISDCWNGKKLNINYCQQTIKNSNDKLSEEEMKKSLHIYDYKDADIIAKQYAIDIDKTINDLKQYHNYQGDDIRIVFDAISKKAYETFRKMRYIRDYKEEISRRYSSIDFVELIKGWDMENKMSLFQHFQNNTIYEEDKINASVYQIFDIEDGTAMLYPEKILELYKGENEIINMFGYYKFNKLMKSISFYK